MSFENILYDVQDHIATITLNRPRKRNALSVELWAELEAACDQIAQDPEVRVVVLRGAGPAFSSGMDMSQPCITLREWQEKVAMVNRRTLKLWRLEKPTIAMVHGYCLAAGCELTFACDITIAGEDAKFGEPEIQHGSMAQLLTPWFLGPKVAKEFILVGDIIDAYEAMRLGIVNHVYPNEELEAQTYKLARKLAKIPPDATRLNKRAMNRAFEIMGILSHGDYVNEVSAILHTLMMDITDEQGQELHKIRLEQGVKAFLKRRAELFAES